MIMHALFLNCILIALGIITVACADTDDSSSAFAFGPGNADEESNMDASVSNDTSLDDAGGQIGQINQSDASGSTMEETDGAATSPQRQARCRLVSMRSNTTTNTTATLVELNYDYDGLNATVTGTYEGRVRFNEAGLVVSSDMDYGNGAHQNIENDYECGDWCKLTQSRSTTISNDYETIVESSYAWRGNEAEISGTYTGSAQYNERGYLLNHTLHYGNGTYYESATTYDCDQWCKPLTSRSETTSNDLATVVEQIYDWQGLSAGISGTYSGMVAYNSSGYMTAQELDYGNGTSNALTMVYSCDD